MGEPQALRFKIIKNAREIFQWYYPITCLMQLTFNCFTPKMISTSVSLPFRSKFFLKNEFKFINKIIFSLLKHRCPTMHSPSFFYRLLCTYILLTFLSHVFFRSYILVAGFQCFSFFRCTLFFYMLYGFFFLFLF